MDIKRLRVGTKVKMLKSNKHYELGEIGTLISGTPFHDIDSVADRSGDYWFSPDKPNAAASNLLVYDDGLRAVCIGTPSSFKVLKY